MESQSLKSTRFAAPFPVLIFFTDCGVAGVEVRFLAAVATVACDGVCFCRVGLLGC